MDMRKHCGDHLDSFPCQTCRARGPAECVGCMCGTHQRLRKEARAKLEAEVTPTAHALAARMGATFIPRTKPDAVEAFWHESLGIDDTDEARRAVDAFARFAARHAQGIAARSDKTGTGLDEGKSPVAEPCAETPADLSSRDTNNVG